MYQTKSWKYLKLVQKFGFISVRAAAALIFLLTPLVQAKSKINFEIETNVQSTVTGTITDSSGQPLPGASVIVEGTTLGTQTDFDGNYSVEADDNATLIFSYMGFTTQKVLVNGQSVINVVLAEDSSKLEEVVVVGYTTQSRATVTGAMSQVDVKEAMDVPIQNAGYALQGRASGVTVVGSGQPGSTPLIRIRGFGTTNANGPLLIIDGVQTTDATVLSQINPNDIQAMNVLKDASAAIYGARASNGVIIITTKSGTRDGKPVVSFSTYLGAQHLGNKPELLNSQQLGEVFWESYLNDGVTPSHAQYGNGAAPVVPEYIRGNPSLPYDVNTNKITRSGDTDWFDETFETAFMQNYDLSIQGGGEKSRYFMSAGYQNTDGIHIKTGFERLATRVNTEFDVTDHIRIGEHLSVAFTDQLTGNMMERILRITPLVPVFDEGGNYGGTGPSTSAGLSNGITPVAGLERAADNFNRGIRVLGDIYAEVKFLDGFTAKSSFGVNFDDRFINIIGRASPEQAEPKGNSLTETHIRASSWIWSNTLRWDKVIGDHSIQLLGGLEAVNDDYRLTTTQVQDFLLEDTDFFILGAGTGTPSITNSIWNNSTLFSYLFNANYSFKSKYLASFSLRHDKTSRFAEGNNSGLFPAGSIGWILSKEKFMEKVDRISYLKLRVSYGELGNQDVAVPNPDVNIIEAQQEVGFYPINGTSVATGAILSSLGNPDLNWERSSQFNIGLDLGLLNDNISLSVDYFNNTTKDMIIASPLPTTSIDAQPPYINAGEVNNSGFDFSFNYNNPDQKSQLKWDLGFNFSAYKNELVKINGNNPASFLNGSVFRSGTITRSSNGLPISYFYGRDVIGIFQTSEEVSSSPDQGFVNPSAGVGRFKYRDVDGNGVINDDDRTVLGDPHPDFTYGFNANFKYNDFFLTFFLQGSQGNQAYNYMKIYTDFPSFFSGNRSARVLDSWRPSNPNASLPALSSSITNNESQPNSYFVEDASYFRLKNLQIGYNFEIPNIGITGARVYLQGTNLFTITNYSGAEPEFGQARDGNDLTLGVDIGRVPQPKTYLLGLNFNF